MPESVDQPEPPVATDPQLEPSFQHAPAPQAHGAETEQPPTPARKKRGCGCAVIGCLVVFLVIALVVFGVAGWYLRWPEQWGLVESPAEDLFESSPNPWATDLLVEEFTELGVSVEGVTFYILPKEGGETHIAYVLVEESRGFTWSHPAFENPIEGLLILTAGSETASAFNIDRVAVDYRDPDDVQVAIMTAPTQALIDFAVGTISQDELFNQMNGRTPDSSPININLGGDE